MQKQGIDLYIMENNDPHESEYLPDHWKEIEWLSGFRGEVATVLVTQEEALLWTDSRFFISGEQQLADSPFKLMKMKVAGVPTVAQWLDDYKAQHDTNCTGGDSRILFGNEVDIDVNLISQIWDDRPSLPMNRIEIYPEALSGEKTADRISRVLDAVEEQGSKSLWLSALDEIAWVLNLRGTDIACTPIFISYLYLSRKGSTIYVHDEKLTDEVRAYLSGLGISILPYEEAANCPYRTMEGPNPIPLMKGIKNAVEIEGYKSVLLKDGIALTRFYHWLEDTLHMARHSATSATIPPVPREPSPRWTWCRSSSTSAANSPSTAKSRSRPSLLGTNMPPCRIMSLQRNTTRPSLAMDCSSSTRADNTSMAPPTSPAPLVWVR